MYRRMLAEQEAKAKEEATLKVDEAVKNQETTTQKDEDVAGVSDETKGPSEAGDGPNLQRVKKAK